MVKAMSSSVPCTCVETLCHSALSCSVAGVPSELSTLLASFET